ncbi:MAG TPA: YfiR family protein [Thermoanaerobaculia bacterium]|nr:YfiR family protein [Thermoanaerobaculia bacterium]
MKTDSSAHYRDRRSPPCKRFGRAGVRVALTLLCGLIPTAGAPAEATATAFKEYQVKAAFLFNFSKFVEWPARKFNDSTSPIVIGILGANPFGSELEKTVKGRHINGRDVVVQQFDGAEAARSAHLLFVSAGSDAAVERLLKALDGSGVLTVGESNAFARYGGIVTFLLEGDKLGFTINIEAAGRAGLKISAQLQKLAKGSGKRP